jgi:hypothetical protein
MERSDIDHLIPPVLLFDKDPSALFIEKCVAHREGLERELSELGPRASSESTRPGFNQRATREVGWGHRSGSGVGSGRMKDGRMPNGGTRQELAVSMPTRRGSPGRKRLEGEQTPIAEVVHAREGRGKGRRERDPARARRTGAGEWAAVIGTARQSPCEITMQGRRIYPLDQVIEGGEHPRLLPSGDGDVTACGPGRTWREGGKDQKHRNRSDSRPSQLLAGRKAHHTSAVIFRVSVLMEPDPNTNT